MNHFINFKLNWFVRGLVSFLLVVMIQSCAGMARDSSPGDEDGLRKHARMIGQGGEEEDFSKDNNSTYMKIFYEGVNLLKLSSVKSLKEARLCFVEVLQKKESFWPAHYNLAYISFLGKKYEESEAHLEDALKHKKEDFHIYSLLASVYYAREEYSRAYDLYNEITEYYDDITLALYQMGNILMLDKKYADALELYNKIGKVRGKYYAVFFNKATCYMELGRFKAASKAFQHVYDIGIRDNYLLKHYAYSLRKQGSLEKAVAMYDELLLFFPEELEGYKNVGVMYELYLDAPEKAIPYYEKYIRKSGKDKAQVINWLSVAKDKVSRRK